MYDFEGGKAYWLASGRPTVRNTDQPVRVMTRMERDVPTCRLGESVEVAMRALDARPGWEQCVVVNDANIVVGVAPRTTTRAERPLVELVRYAPTTVRPDAELDETLDRMHERKIRERIVTDPTGRLLGVLRLPAS